MFWLLKIWGKIENEFQMSLAGLGGQSRAFPPMRAVS